MAPKASLREIQNTGVRLSITIKYLLISILAHSQISTLKIPLRRWEQEDFGG